jgi:hypothetical protein
MEVLTNEYFRVDLQDQLPVGELKRREAIKETLESQFRLWETEEQHRLCTLFLECLKHRKLTFPFCRLVGNSATRHDFVSRTRLVIYSPNCQELF